MTELHSWVNRFMGFRAYVIGKGPGLDRAVKGRWEKILADAHSIRIGINDAVDHVPHWSLAFAVDTIALGTLRSKYPRYPGQRSSWERAVIGPDFLDMPRVSPDLALLGMHACELEELNTLYGCGGTLPYALHFLWCAGIRDVVLVGCEGVGGYAKVTKQQAGNMDQWKRIRMRSEIVMRVLGMKWRDW